MDWTDSAHQHLTATERTLVDVFAPLKTDQPPLPEAAGACEHLEGMIAYWDAHVSDRLRRLLVVTVALEYEVMLYHVQRSAASLSSGPNPICEHSVVSLCPVAECSLRGSIRELAE